MSSKEQKRQAIECAGRLRGKRDGGKGVGGSAGGLVYGRSGDASLLA